MAKARVSTNPMYTGGAGGYTFYVRAKEQIVRQRRNNSNYGETASRSYAQMIRRIKWGNLVNVYKSIRSWQKKAYDSKVAGQTDYNLFMKLNIGRCSVGVTKQACEQGFGVWEDYQISNGSLPVVGYQLSSTAGRYKTGIVITAAITAETTVGELSADILDNNPEFVGGDNIAFVFFTNWKMGGSEWPYASSVYTELTLDASSTIMLSDLPDLGERLIESADEYLEVTYERSAVTDSGHEVGIAIIHTRKSAGALYVSPQSILLNDDSLVSEYSGSDWYNACISSYGIDESVPLDPGSGGGGFTPVPSVNVLTQATVVNLTATSSSAAADGTSLFIGVDASLRPSLRIVANPDHSASVAFFTNDAVNAGDEVMSSRQVPSGSMVVVSIPPGARSMLIRVSSTGYDYDFTPSVAIMY